MTEPIWLQPPRGGYPEPWRLSLTGIEQMRAGMRGEVPASPMVYLTGMRFFGTVSRGFAGFAIPASPWFANATGLIPGGILAMLSDAPLGASLHTDLPAATRFTTAELSLTFLRPVHPDSGTLISGSGQLIHRTRTTGLTEAFLINETTGDLVAFGSSRLSIFPPLDEVPPKPDEPPVFDGPAPGEAGDDPWQREPVEGEPLPPEVFQERSGLSILEGMISGELPTPPITHLTGLRNTVAAEGEVTLTMPCSPWLSTSAGTVQGGFTAMLGEAALAAAAFCLAPAGTAVAPLDLKVNFLRPVFPDGRELTARARVLHRGRTLSVSSAEVLNADGKPVALATGSAMNLPGRPADLAGEELGGPGRYRGPQSGGMAAGPH